jgi:di/tricarboxylate transporter
MTPEIALLLAIIAVATVFFAFDWVPADVVALGVLVALILTGILPAEKAFAGFGSETVLMILGLFILTSALLRTGFVDIAGRAILRRSGTDPDRLLLIIMVSAAVLSAFISNTAATAFFLPVTFGIAERAKQSPSRFLMPLAFASILTSSVTLVSTSTNLVASGLMTRYGMEPLGMFELAPAGVPIAVAGLLYMWFIGRRWIPERAATGPPERFGLRPYLTEVLVLPGSPLEGKTLEESGLGRDLDLTILRIVRDKHQYLSPFVDVKLEAGDVLLVEGLREEILKVKDTAGIDIKADVKLAEPGLEGDEAALVEGILLPRSPLIGRTLKRARFRERHGLQVLAINRSRGSIHRKISQIPLRMGDVLLVQGRRENLKALEGTDTFRILGAVDEERPNVKRAWTALGIFASSLLAATTGIMDLPVAVLLGSLLVFVTRCITPEEAYREVEWKALILIGCMLGLGSAMEATGAERYFAAGIVDLVGWAGPIAILTGFFFLTVGLTQPMSNQAAAVVVLPVAIQTAKALGLDPRPFAVMVAVAASCSYLTPLEPSCLMVYGPGRYRFADFVKVGGALTFIIYAIAIAIVPLIWNLQ